VLSSEEIAEINRRIQRAGSANSWTGTSGTIAADARRLVNHIKEISDMSAPSAQPGTTAKFGTGAVRSNEVEDLRYDLITPIGLREVARAYAEGSGKYGDFNWEKGMPVHDLLNHAIAHIYRFLEGDRSEPHLGHAAWNVLAAIHSYELWPHLNKGTLRWPDCTPPAAEPVSTTVG